MKKNSVTEFELERQTSRSVSNGGTNGPSSTPGTEDAQVISYVPPTVAIQAPAMIPAQAPAPPPSPELEIKSPMIGTYYHAPSPEAAPYVEVGSEVNPETVVCIIEAMKVMNEIKAEAKGTVTAVLVENGKPVNSANPSSNSAHPLPEACSKKSWSPIAGRSPYVSSGL